MMIGLDLILSLIYLATPVISIITLSINQQQKNK